MNLVLTKAVSLTLALFALAGEKLCAQERSFRRFGGPEGLTNLAIRRIYEDRVGFIWVSTENGIFRYDGDRFEPFGTAQGMPQNSGVAFGDAPDGSLLVGGNFGLYRLLGNRFEKVPGAFNTIPWAQAIQSDGKGHTYIGTDTGLVELDSLPGQSHFQCGRFLNPREQQRPAHQESWWMATSCGMAAGTNFAAWMPIALESFRGRLDFPTGKCKSS